MTYNYICDKCQKKYEITKRVKDYNRKELCECGEVIRKVYNAVSIKTNDGYKS